MLAVIIVSALELLVINLTHDLLHPIFWNCDICKTIMYVGKFSLCGRNSKCYLKLWSTANLRYTSHTTDYKQTDWLVMLPFRSIVGWYCVSWDFLLHLALQPITTINWLHTSWKIEMWTVELWPWFRPLNLKQVERPENVTSKHDL